MLIDEIEASCAELLPFFLDINSTPCKETANSSNIQTYTPQVDIIAREIWDLLESGGHIDVGSELPSLELIAHCSALAIKKLSERYRFSLNETEIGRQQIVSLIYDKGPLEPLFQNVQISDIIINNYKKIQVVQGGQIRETSISFRSESEYNYFIRQCIPDQTSWDKSWYEGLLDDPWGTRVTATQRDQGVEVVLRIPRMHGSELSDLLRARILPPSLALWLSELILMRKANILIVGAPRCGKTTLLYALLAVIYQEERVCIVEYIRELGRLLKTHESFPAFLPVDEIIHAIVRKIPERLVVAEVDRPGGVEVFIECIESGFEGVMGSMVASSAEVALAKCSRLLHLGQQLNELSQYHRIVRSVNIVIVMENHEGLPCIKEVWELCSETAHNPLKLLVNMEPDSKGKRLWYLKEDHSFWLDSVGVRGRYLDTESGVLK